MAGGLTAATNRLFSTIEGIPSSFGQGLQRGTNIRVTRDQNQRAQIASDFQSLKSLSQIHGPKMKGLLMRDPEQAKVYLEKVKASNPDLIERLGLETFTASLDKKNKVQWKLLKKVDDKILQDIKIKPGQDSGLNVGDSVAQTFKDGDYTYEASKTTADPLLKDFSPTNVTSLLGKIMDSQGLGQEDVGKGVASVRALIKELNPDSRWLKKGALDKVGEDHEGDRRIGDPKEAKKELGSFKKLFSRLKDPDKAFEQAFRGYVEEKPVDTDLAQTRTTPVKRKEPIPFESFRDNPVQGIPVIFPNGQTKAWKGGPFNQGESWKDV